VHSATHPPGFGYRERLTRTRQQPRGKTNMSAKALAACSFEPAAKQTVATVHHAPAGIAAEIQFREDLWHEYWLEAINAGFSTAQATEYASALSPEIGRVAGVSEMAPTAHGWFYQSRTWATNRTVTSGLITLKRWEKSKTTQRIEAAGATILAREFRWWNACEKS
jgi:hypothetical protein